MRRVPDVSLCEKLLGVKAQVDIDDGLARTIEWQRRVTGKAAGLSAMRIGVIGGGLMGLAVCGSPAVRARPRPLTVFERAPQVGGLATWQDFGAFVWDRFYHVILPSDAPLIGFLRTHRVESEAALGPDEDRLLRRQQVLRSVQQRRVPEIPAAEPVAQVPARADHPLLLPHQRLAQARDA